MTFKEFINFIEQGTKTSTTGLGAGGRAGQSQATPESGVTNMPNPNDKKIPASPFNVSSKGTTNTRPANPKGSHGPGVKPLPNPPVSPFSFDMKQPQPTQSPAQKVQQVPSPIR